MSSIPGMADGRFLGLTPYRSMGEVNEAYQVSTNIMDNNELRMHMQHNSETVDQFFSESIDQDRFRIQSHCKFNRKKNVD